MEEEKKVTAEGESAQIARRSFLKGVAGAAVTAAATSGGVMSLFPSEAEAQKSLAGKQPIQSKLVLNQTIERQLSAERQLLDEDQQEDDLGDLAQLYLDAADDGFNQAEAVVEKLITDERYRLSFQRNSAGAIRSQFKLGSQLQLRGLKLSPSILQKVQEARAEGWHVHGSFSLFGLRLHTHLSW